MIKVLTFLIIQKIAIMSKIEILNSASSITSINIY